ncbi:MAG: trypsin-like peptidase domain-containing protein [Rhizobiaceae bacterium]|nr:trypsin-like peptidase domain-containing protein [Rhizobiaceae bacterium]
MGFWDCSDRLAAARARKMKQAQLDGELVLAMAGADGSEQTFPRHLSSVKVGREAGWADYAMPPTDRNVSSRHLELRRQASGQWFVERQGENFIAVNGKPVKSTAVLYPGDVLTLGNDKGPQIRFDLKAAPEASLTGSIRTFTQQAVQSTEDLLCAHMRKTVAGFAVLAVAITAVGGFSLYSIGERDRKIAALTEHLKLAAHVVVLRAEDDQREAIATAWPISETEMVTNAHVADAIVRALRGSGGNREVLVLGKASDGGEPTMHRVVTENIRVHPGYEAFNNFATTGQGALGFQTLNGNFAQTPLPRGYDLAILPIETPVDPARVMRTRAVDHPLRANDEIWFGGYLLRGVDGCDVSGYEPDPDIQRGAISRLANFFNAPSDDLPEHQRLIRHSVPVTGGASGGPIVDIDGFVVGVVTAGTVVPVSSAPSTAVETACSGGSRAPSAVQVNFAQRADLVEHLLGAEFDDDQEMEFWAGEASRYVSHAAYLEEKLLASANRDHQVPFRLVMNLPPEPRGLVSEHRVSLRAGRDYLITLYSKSPTPLQAFLKAGDQDLGQDMGRAAHISFEADQDLEATISVVSQSQGDYTLKVFEAD